MAPFPNIKVMDTLVFVAAFLFGLRVGVGVGAFSWLVYGSWNPYGPVSMILLFQIIGETFYALAGAILRKTSFSDLILKGQEKLLGGVSGYRVKYLVVLPILGFIGLITALSYDVFTNTATWFLQLYDPSKNIGAVFFQSFGVGLLTMNFPFPFGIMHQVSDLLFFAFITPVVVKASSKLDLVLVR